tara:strand:+ start:57 stop:452 length:396 start_codon:yes stop_codon:yes gene_type:complete
MIKYSISIIIFLFFTKTIISQTYNNCGFNFTKSELNRPSNKSYYKFSDTTHYACYENRVGSINKDSLLNKINLWDQKKSTIAIQKIRLTSEEKSNHNTKVDTIIVIWEKLNLNKSKFRRKKIIKRVIKNCG